MNLSLIIPAHNEEKYIGTCLEHILKYAPADLTEIIVIDNASTDRTAEVARAYPRVRVVCEPNKGLLFARQRGLMEAKGDLLAYVDADTQIPPAWFNTIRTEFSKDSSLACLSGPYIYFDVSLWQKISIWLYWNVLAYLVYLLVGYMVIGGNFVVKKQAMNKIGGFNLSISFYGEDNDLARRLHEQAAKIKFARKFVILTSPRRLDKEGFWQAGLRYMMNFLWVAIFHKPYTTEYRDIR